MNDGFLTFLLDEGESRPLTVSELNSEVRELLEGQFRSIWAEGEVINFVGASSGHWYFNLNDGKAQIRCVCWKGTNFRVRFKPQNGVKIRIRGRLTLYEARGEFQLVVETLEPSGDGALLAAFEQIKATLEADGLFAEELKRPIPFLPRRVAVITSRSGVAYHDIHSVLTRRSRSVSILLIPALVQGEGAADSIRTAVVGINAYNHGLSSAERIDVLIVGRGGGSAEDLWAFNDEALARAIRSSEIPVISAVGHEVDWTIADLVCDLRAATPSAAAEMVACREEDLIERLHASQQRLAFQVAGSLADAGNAVYNATVSLDSALTDRLRSADADLQCIAALLSPTLLYSRTAAVASSLKMLDHRSSDAVRRSVTSKTDLVNVDMAKLDALSPLAVLSRGYSITQNAEGGVLRDAAEVSPGHKLKIRLERGTLNAEVVSADG